MATVSSLDVNQWASWANGFTSAYSFFVNALNALTARQTYVQTTHPEWQTRYNALRQQGSVLYGQMSALRLEAVQVSNYFKNNVGALGAAGVLSVVASVLGPLAPQTQGGLTVSYTIDQANTITNSAQQWAVLANTFVQQCDAAYSQEQHGATPAQTSAMSGANVSSALPSLPDVLSIPSNSVAQIPIIGGLITGAENFAGSLGKVAMYLALFGVGAIVLPEIIRNVRRGR